MTLVPMSWHAEQRRWEHGFTLDQVTKVALEPDLDYPAHPRYGPGCRIHQKGPIATVHAPDGLIITILPSGKATGYGRWNHCQGPE